MNKTSRIRYIGIALLLIFALIYALPNVFSSNPSIEITTSKSIDRNFKLSVFNALNSHNIKYKIKENKRTNLKLIFTNNDDQMESKSLIDSIASTYDKYTVAMGLESTAPKIFTYIGAHPMYLGLDLRGGIHFLFQMNTDKLIENHLNYLSNQLTQQLESVSYLNVSKQKIIACFNTEKAAKAASKKIKSIYSEVDILERNSTLELIYKSNYVSKLQREAIKQNIFILHNRINALGVSEPIIQKEGDNRIVVELPGVQDIAYAKKILGKTITLELHLVSSNNDQENYRNSNIIPSSDIVYPEINDDAEVVNHMLIDKNIIFTGENIIQARSGEDQSGLAAVFIHLDNKGSSAFRQITADNIGRRIAIVLFDNNKGSIITAPVINEPIPSGSIQISGHFTDKSASELALLLKSGSLSAPIEIIQEKNIGPSLGKKNIVRGVYSTLFGLALIAIFIISYYDLIGIISVFSLISNLILLIAILSVMQATLTLPGIAAIALTLGMAIDANILINERIREELRSNIDPSLAIDRGYKYALATIIDSNVTTLIAGLALLIFGSNSIKGFAIIHCLGISTSLFSSIIVSRAMVNLLYGNNKKIKHIRIG